MESKRTGLVHKRRLKAVFFLDAVSYLAPMLAAWQEAGHEVAAFVMPQTKKISRTLRKDRWLGRLYPEWSIARAMSSFPDAQLFNLPLPVDWNILKTQFSDIEADVLISVYFPLRVPHDILSLFPNGGVNLHPAILPNYRGPQPLQQMILQDDWLNCGGVTLHCMSDRFDEGDIIAQTHFNERDWKSRTTLNRALANAMIKLVQEAVPAFCLGKVCAVPQPEGEYVWAGMQMDTCVKTDWTIDYLKRVLTFLSGRPGVFIEIDGNLHKLSAHDVRVIGEPIGQKSSRKGERFEFDLKDARVSCVASSRIRRSIRKIQTAWGLRMTLPEDVALRYADDSVES